jgi:glycosyltransferase involved in cell wall biosynthesis
MTTKPLVSIVICTQNRLEALQKYALSSVFNIDYPSFEVVIVDDASTDETKEFLQIFKKDHLKVIRNDRKRGLCNARNLGIDHCSGEIIAFIDDDCLVSRDWLKELVEVYAKEDVAVVGGISYRGDTSEIYIDDKRIWGCNMSFRASIFKQFRFDTGLKYSHYGDEGDIIGRIVSHGYKKAIADKAIVKHYVADAAYRKQNALTAYLNSHYLGAKNGSLWGYYKYVVTLSLKHVAIVEYGLNFKERRGPVISMCVAVLGKILYYLYVLILEIPLSAKIKHAQEEALFKRNSK